MACGSHVEELGKAHEIDLVQKNKNPVIFLDGAEVLEPIQMRL